MKKENLQTQNTPDSANDKIKVYVPAKLKSIIERFDSEVCGDESPVQVLPLEGKNESEIIEKLTTLLSSGEENFPDVLLASDENITEFAKQAPDLFVDFREYGNTDEYYNFKLGELLMSDGSICGVPFSGSPVAFYYNKDLLVNAGCEINGEITWEQFVNIGKKVKEESGIPMLPFPDKNDVYTMLKSYGVCFYDENGAVTQNGCREVMEFFEKLKNEELLTEEELDYDKRLKYLSEGKIVGIMAGSAALNDIVSELKGSEFEHWGVIAMPKSETFTHNVNGENGYSWLIKRSRDEEKIKTVFDWLERVIDANMLSLVTEKNFIPVRSEIISQCENLPNEQCFDKNVIYYLATIGADIPIVVRGEKNGEFSNCLFQKVEKILREELSIDDACVELENELFYSDSGSGGSIVKPKEHRHYLKILAYPEKREYIEGESFETKGLKVGLVTRYEDESIPDDYQVVENYTVLKKSPLQSGDDHVEVVYLHENICYAVDIPVRVKHKEGNLKNKAKNAFGCFPKVNLLTGDVTYESGDLSVGVSRNAISISHVYNSDAIKFYGDVNTGMGSGWKLNVQQYIATIDSNLYYIDGSGYMHEFRNYSISGSNDIYQDVDGENLTLYTKRTFGGTENCSILKDSGNNYIVFDAQGKMIRMIPAPCDAENLSTARAIVVEYENGKITSVYDNRATDTKIIFEYTENNITKISVNEGDTTLKSVEFTYGDGNTLTVRKRGNITERYSYAGAEYSFGGLEYSYFLLSGITSDETKSTAVVEYESNSSQAKTVKIGCIDEAGKFVEKSRSSFTFKKNDNGEVIKTDVTNEKGICIENMFNEAGEIVSSFEKKDNKLYTLQKESGKRFLLDNIKYSSGYINDSRTFCADKDICRCDDEFDLRRGSEKGVRNYIVGCYVKLKESTIKKLQAIATYTFNDNVYSYNVKVDNTAANVWQKIGVSLRIPKETADGAMKIKAFSLGVYDELGNAVQAEYSDFLVTPCGAMSTIMTGDNSAYDLRYARKAELTDKNGQVTSIILGMPVTVSYRKGFFNRLNLTYNDLLETAKSMYVNRNGNSGFFFYYNGGKDRYANVKDVKIVFDSEKKLSIADVSTGTCFFRLEQYSADNGTVTRVKNTLKADGVLCETTITTYTGESKKSSSSCEFTSYDGRKLYQKDAYGVKTTYEYDAFLNPTRITRSANGKEMLLSEAEYDEQGEYLESLSSGYSSSAYSYAKPFETLKEERERSFNLANGTYANTGLKRVVDYDEDDRVKTVKLKKDETTYFQSEVTYEDGKIRTVSDGNSKYGIKYDMVNDSVTYTAFDGETETDLQKYSDVYNDATKQNTSTERYFKGDGKEDVITTKTDQYGRTLSASDGEKTIKYTYTNDVGNGDAKLVYRGYDGLALLNKVKDPYEGTEYSYRYDYDGQMCGWDVSGKLSVRKLSANEVKYTFGGNGYENEKYKTEEVYDENVVNQPRVFGSKIYTDSQTDNKDDWNEIELFNVGYTYDDLGRVSKKTQNKGEYKYTYLTDGNGGLLPDVKDISFTFAKNNSKKWTYSHGYDNKGNLTEVNLAKSTGGQGVSTKYTYDDANRLKTEAVTVGGTKSVDRVYDYQSNGKGRLVKITDKLDGSKSKEFFYDGRGRISGYSQGSKDYAYTYDNFGNVVKKKENNTELYSCEWERGNLLKKVTKDGAEINYEYNHRCVRFRKTANGVTTNYYLDGSKILGESRSDGKELRYFYDSDGLLGVKYGNTYYGYIKDGQGNISAIVAADGLLVAQYEYDSFGNATVKNVFGNIITNANFIGNINPFRWKGFYYDVETGMYYANGRYYETERGGYIDAIEADIVEGNAYNAVGLDRNGIMLLTILMLAPYSASISTMLELYTDPNYEPSDGPVQETFGEWWKKHWWEVLCAAINIAVGVVQILARDYVRGIISIFSGVNILFGAIFSEQLAGAIGTAALGVQTIAIGVQSLACNPVYGLIAIIVGASCVAFASAEAQESLGYGNWLKDVVGMSDEVYNGVMNAVNMAAISINIVGVKQCFKEGTLVACLDENGEEIRKPIESITVGTFVLAYDEFTGEKAYKKVLQLFRNETKEWYHVTVDITASWKKLYLHPDINTIYRKTPTAEIKKKFLNMKITNTCPKNGFPQKKFMSKTLEIFFLMY